MRHVARPAGLDFSLSDARILKHALNAPITSLKIAADSLNSQDKQRQVQASADMISASTRITNLISSFTGSFAKESFKLVDTVTELCSFFQSQNITLICHVCTKNAYQAKIAGSKLLFQEVLSSLIVNAIEAYTVSELPLIVVVMRCNRISAVVQIQDFGVGMSSVATQLALRPGITYKPGGTGLGLSFARQTLLKLFDGQLEMRSRLGRGTLMTITLPLAQRHVSIGSQNLVRFESLADA